MYWTDYVSRGGLVHALSRCAETREDGGPENCTVHRPSIHKLTGSRQILRLRSGLIEDECMHGIGHPNPDSAAFLNWTYGSAVWGIHGCDGCCGEIT